MRLIDGDALMERSSRERVDSREAIAQMINSAPTVSMDDMCVALKKELDYWYELAKSYERTILELCTVLIKEIDE